MPDLISLTAGFPPNHTFPFSNISLRLHDGTSVDLPDVATAQQYNASLRGYPSLLQWAINHIQALHRPPSPHEVLITNGANHSIEMITSLFLERGDAILVEEYTYPVILEAIAVPKGYRTLAVPIDNSGIIPDGLLRVMEEAVAAAAAGGPRPPKLLYTVPTGHNPTGGSISPERKKAVYDICSRFDVWIVEDDPYFYLQWGAAAAALLEDDPEGLSEDALRAVVPGLAGICSSSNSSSSSSNSSSSAAVPMSYLNMDIDGRVIRVDSFAKFLAPGFRLGMVSARNDVIEKLTSVLQTHTVGPCTLSQAVVASMLEAWGDTGLDAHLRRIQSEYARRCAVLCRAAAKELTGYAEFQRPSAGMFLWIRVLGVQDASEIWDSLQAERVIVCPGRVMSAVPSVQSPFVRVAFSSMDVDALKEGMARLGRVLRKIVEQ